MLILLILLWIILVFCVTDMSVGGMTESNSMVQFHNVLLILSRHFVILQKDLRNTSQTINFIIMIKVMDTRDIHIYTMKKKYIAAFKAHLLWPVD